MKHSVLIVQDDTSQKQWAKTRLLQYLGGKMDADASCMIQFRDGTQILVQDNRCTCQPVFFGATVSFGSIDDCPLHGLEPSP